MSASARPLRVAGLLFVLTGASALIAEQAFEKLLEPLLGTTVHAAAAVLSIYFAGLTIGGWAYRFVRRLAPLRVYALLELGVGVWALLLYASFDHLTEAFLPLLRRFADDFAGLELARLGVAAAWILPPTILMGATFPAMVDHIQGERRAVARFYALNLLGATLAAGLAPYALFAPLGLDKSLLTAACLDLAVAIVAFPARRRPAGWPGGVPPPPPREPRPNHALILAAALSGLLFFALEVIWTHLIAAVCGNSVYAFAAMLFAVLCGLFLGSAASARLAPADEAIPVALPAFAFVLGAALLALQQIAWPYAPHLFTVFGNDINTFAAAEGLRTGIALLLIVPVAATLGSVLPMLFRLREFPLHEQGRTAGAMTAANAIGCCAGALLAVFVLIPDVGSELALRGIAALYVLIAVAVLFATKTRIRRAVLVIAGATLLLSLAAPRWDRLRLTSGENVYFANVLLRPDSRLLFFHEDAAGGMTTVVGNGAERRLLTNGKFQGANIGELAAQRGFALVPALHAARFDDALVIGFGTGQSARVVHDLGFARVDVAEIAPGILTAARQWFPDINGRVLEQPNVRTFVDDGRNVLQLHDRSYDLITIELTSVWFAGATNLYSRDFYRAAAARLRPGGVLQQWLQLHHLGTREVASALGSVRSVFPYVSFWIVGRQGIIVATKEPQLVRREGLARAIRVAGIDGVRPLFDSRVLAEDEVPRFVAAMHAPINDDRNRWLEYRTPRYNFALGDLLLRNARILKSFAK